MNVPIAAAVLLTALLVVGVSFWVFWKATPAVWRGSPSPGDCAHFLTRDVIRLVQRDDPTADSTPWPWIYFHGRLLDHVGGRMDAGGWDGAPDLVASPNTSLESPADGEHDVLVYDRPARLFIWTDEEESQVYHFGPKSGCYTKRIRRGLVCLPDDRMALKYAREKLRERPNYL